jgi:hypothetical protein
LAGSERLAGLRRLDLRGVELGEKARTLLIQRFGNRVRFDD